jgi:hypothetical protein
VFEKLTEVPVFSTLSLATGSLEKALGAARTQVDFQ